MTTRAGTIALLLTLATVGPPGPARLAGQPAGEPAIVARAGDLIVTADELRREVLLRRRGGGPGDVLRTLTPDGIEQVARDVLERKLLAAEARARGLADEPGVIEMTGRAVDAVLADILVTRVIAAVDTSEPALRRFYADHPDAFRTGPRRRARHIVVATEDEARAAQAALAAGRPFAAVASERNIDSTRSTGGDLGWVPRGLMVPAVDRVLFELGPGEVSAIVRTTMGFHLLLVEDVDPGTLPAFDLVRDRVADVAQREAVRHLTERLWNRRGARVDTHALAMLLGLDPPPEK